jgi:hypothetical protein
LTTGESAQTPAPAPPVESTTPRPPGWGHWALGLILPGLCMAGICVALIALEWRTHDVSRWLGEQLLQGNNARPPMGSAWEVILAGRQARQSITAAAAEDSLLPEAVPLPTLQSRYTQEQRSEHFVIFTKRRRASALRPEGLSAGAVRELAATMQVYRRGRELLGQLQLPAEPFAVHARIQAQIELEEGRLFAVLHQRLLTTGSASAWDFVRMSQADREYWSRLLRPALDAPTTAPLDLDRQAPAVAAATTALVAEWADSLRCEEAARLRQSWEDSSRYQIRLVRSMDRFIGHALHEDELAVQFELPTPLVDAVLGLRQREVEP